MNQLFSLVDEKGRKMNEGNSTLGLSVILDERKVRASVRRSKVCNAPSADLPPNPIPPDSVPPHHISVASRQSRDMHKCESYWGLRDKMLEGVNGTLIEMEPPWYILLPEVKK